MILVEDTVKKKHESADEIKVPQSGFQFSFKPTLFIEIYPQQIFMVTTIMILKKIDYNNSTIAFVTVLMNRYMFPVIEVLTSDF